MALLIAQIAFYKFLLTDLFLLNFAISFLNYIGWGSGIRNLDPGSKGRKGPGSRIRITAASSMFNLLNFELIAYVRSECSWWWRGGTR